MKRGVEPIIFVYQLVGHAFLLYFVCVQMQITCSLIYYDWFSLRALGAPAEWTLLSPASCPMKITKTSTFDQVTDYYAQSVPWKKPTGRLDHPAAYNGVWIYAHFDGWGHYKGWRHPYQFLVDFTTSHNTEGITAVYGPQVAVTSLGYQYSWRELLLLEAVREFFNGRHFF